MEQLKNTHSEQNWFVPTKIAIQGLSTEQSNWKDSTENHSIAELVSHLSFWNGMNLRAFKGEDMSDFDVDNNATIGTLDDESNLSADNNIVISSVGRNCVVEADNNLIVQIAEASAALKAGNRKQVARIVGLETPASRSPSPSKNRFNF